MFIVFNATDFGKGLRLKLKQKEAKQKDFVVRSAECGAKAPPLYVVHHTAPRSALRRDGVVPVL